VRRKLKNKGAKAERGREKSFVPPSLRACFLKKNRGLNLPAGCGKTLSLDLNLPAGCGKTLFLDLNRLAGCGKTLFLDLNRHAGCGETLFLDLNGLSYLL
jgi:hypothetical protein